MHELAKGNHRDFVRLFGSIEVTRAETGSIDYYHALEEVGDLIQQQAKRGCKLMFIGNGASAAISSHVSTDYWKNGGIQAIAFNDGALLTCVSNDYGYKHVFEKPIEMFANNEDILFAISSSGRSENILRGVNAARAKGCHVITLSGFRKDNPLRPLGDINFYVPSMEYGHVEIIHHYICHCILDLIMQTKTG